MIWRILLKMIEFFTRKRMAIAIVILTVVSVIALVIETNIRIHPEMKGVTESLNSSSDCGGSYETTEECMKCSAFETNAMDFCKQTGYREKIKCKDSPKKEFYRSCPKLTWMEERNFWIFEVTTAIIGILSYGVVFLREKRLDRLLMDKVNKQIAAGI